MHREKNTEPVTAFSFFPWHKEDPRPADPPDESPEIISARIRREIFGLKE